MASSPCAARCCPATTKRWWPPCHLSGQEERVRVLPERPSRRWHRLRVLQGAARRQRSAGGRHATFLVRKSVFAYYLNDHHGDGIVSVCCKVLPGDNEALVAAMPPFWSGRACSRTT